MVEQQQPSVYVGTYTHGPSQGIYFGRLDLASGRLDLVGTASGLENPSFLALDTARRRLYAVSEVTEYAGQPTGAVGAFALDMRTGQPTLLNSLASGGPVPCHLSLEATGRCLFVANYGGGSVAVLPLHDGGHLAPAAAVHLHQGSGTDAERQDRPHAHSITGDSQNRFALALDLGIDQILVYQIDVERCTLVLHTRSFISVRAGAGPRHLAFHPKSQCVYTINELDSTLDCWKYDAEQGTLQAVDMISTLPAEFVGRNFASEVRVHPSGRFLYAANRGHDSIAVFSIMPGTGRLTSHGHIPSGGRTPRHMALDPTGTFLLVANQDTDTVVSFRIDPETGVPAPTGFVTPIPSPTCVQMGLFPVPEEVIA